MERIVLVKPEIKHKEAVKEFMAEFFAENSDFHGFDSLEKYTDYCDWLVQAENDSKEGQQREGRVPAETLFAWDKQKQRILGIVNIRYYLNDYLLKYGGNIGLSVRPSERFCGFGTVILSLAKKKLFRIGDQKSINHLQQREPSFSTNDNKKWWNLRKRDC